MAIQPSRALGCSDCLIEAIVLHDERRLHQLLSADSAEFSETYWVPRASVLDFMTSFPKSSRDPPLSSQLAAQPSRTALILCSRRRWRPENSDFSTEAPGGEIPPLA